jgi:hypothetical protein
MKHYSLIALMLCLGLFIGCSSKVKVSGKITFTDGDPVPIGQVVFEDGQHTYFGLMQPDSRYSVGVLKDGDGIPPGKYRVAVAGAMTDVVYQDEKLVSPAKQLVADKWTDSKTSGLEYDVKKSMVVDIQAERK